MFSILDRNGEKKNVRSSYKKIFSWNDKVRIFCVSKTCF